MKRLALVNEVGRNFENSINSRCSQHIVFEHASHIALGNAEQFNEIWNGEPPSFGVFLSFNHKSRVPQDAQENELRPFYDTPNSLKVNLQVKVKT